MLMNAVDYVRIERHGVIDRYLVGNLCIVQLNIC